MEIVTNPTVSEEEKKKLEAQLLVEEACEKDESLMEKFVDSGLSYLEFFEKHMKADAVTTPTKTQDEINQEKADEELQAHNEAKAAEEKLAKEQADEEEQERKALQNQEDNEASLIDCFEVVGRFYVRAPDENGDVVKRIAQPGEKIAAEYISEEIVSLNLVKKV